LRINQPLRDGFAVLFFVLMGILFDPRVLLEQFLQVLTVLAIIVFDKSLAAFLLVLAFRYGGAGNSAWGAAGGEAKPDSGRRADFHRTQSAGVSGSEADPDLDSCALKTDAQAEAARRPSGRGCPRPGDARGARRQHPQRR